MSSIIILPPTAVQIPLGLVIGYFLATISESIVHRLIGHAAPWQRRLWKQLPWLLNQLSLSHFRHGVVHHCLTFRSNFLTKLDSKSHERYVIQIALKKGDNNINSKHCNYGLTIGWIGFLNFNLTTLPFLPIIAMTLGLSTALSCLPMLMLTPSLSRWIHPFLHVKPDIAPKQAPRLISLLLKTKYFKYVARHHFLHHKYHSCNFNLLLGGDWLLGVHRSPSPADLLEMKDLGLKID